MRHSARAERLPAQVQVADQLVDVIRIVARGDSLLAPAITHRVIEEFVRQPAPTLASAPQFAELTHREREVMRTSPPAAAMPRSPALLVSEPTVKTHVARVLMTLGLRDRVQVAT